MLNVPATPSLSRVTNMILFHDCMCCGAASFFCAKEPWLWLVQSQDSSALLLSWLCLSKGAVGGICRVGRRGQQGLRIWREASQRWGAAAIQQLESKPGRLRAEPFNSALLWSVVAVISLPSCRNADLSVTDWDYVSPAGDSESLGGSSAFAWGHSFSASELGLPSWSAGFPPPPSMPRPILRDLPFHALLCSCRVCSQIPAAFIPLGSWLLPPHKDSEPCLWCFVAVMVHGCSSWSPVLCLPGCSSPVQCPLCGHCRTVPWIRPLHISEAQGMSWCHQTPRGFWSCWSLHLLRSYLTSSVADSSHLFFLPCLC